MTVETKEASASGSERLTALIAPHCESVGGLLQALRAVQHAYGHVSDEAEAIAANLFNVSRAEVKGVVSFYSDFHKTPVADVPVRVCAAEACQALGGRALRRDVDAALSNTAQGRHAGHAEEIFCLGLCSVAPAAMVGDCLIGRATAEKVVAAATAASEGAS
ncbi:MAG: NAD(P)H-dependent oxidoreductase subunit E [Pseudomonadota bacterium]